MIRVKINGVEVEVADENIRTDLPTIQEMQNMVRLYIYKMTGRQINIALNQENLNMELILLEKAYKIAASWIQNNM